MILARFCEKGYKLFDFPGLRTGIILLHSEMQNGNTAENSFFVGENSCKPANLKSSEGRLLKLTSKFETRSTTESKKFQGRFLRYQCRSFARYFGRYVENDERKNLEERKTATGNGMSPWMMRGQQSHRHLSRSCSAKRSFFFMRARVCVCVCVFGRLISGWLILRPAFE